MAAAVLFGAASCAKEDISSSIANGETVEVTFTANLPELGTRAYGDGTNANVVYVNVYEANSNTLLGDLTRDEGYTVSGKQAKVNIALVKGMKYDIVFWAQNAACNYYRLDGKVVKVDYNNATANDNSRDAFYAYVQDFDPIAPNGKDDVKLYRPFAQLNAATLDKQDVVNSGVQFLTRSEVKTYTYTQFNIAEGDVEGNLVEVSFSPTTIPANLDIAEVLPGKENYTYLSMNYLLVNDKELVDATFKFYGKRTEGDTEFLLAANTYSNVPLQRNYRTNILGKLITKSTDFYVEIKPAFDNTEYEVVAVNNTAELQDALDNAVAGTTIELQPGVNYGAVVIRPVAGAANTITDCDYLVYRNEMLRKVENLTIVGAVGAKVEAIKVQAGHIEGSTGYVVDIKNLVIDGVEFSDTHVNPPHSYAAPIFFDLSYINVDGLTVKNCKLIGNNSNMNFVYLYGSGNPSNSTFVTAAKDITIANNVVDGIARLCELRQANNVTITGNTIKNTALHGMLLPVDGGTYSGNVTIQNNTAEGIRDRFVRMAGAGDAVVVVKDNIINNYLGADEDYIKVTDGTNVTIKNNTFGSVGAIDTTSVQAILDNAVAGTTIQLQPGVNYGKVYLRPVAGSPATKEVDWQGNNYRWETYSCFENLTIVGAQGATIDAIQIEGGTYYNTAHSQAATYPVMLSLVELKNVVLDGVTFTGKGGYDPQGYGNAINLSGGNIKVDGLTFNNCVLNNSENNARLLYKTESTTHVHTYTYNGETFTFSPSLKNITITGCTLNGGYMGLELRETENVTITNNVFEVGDRNILLAVNTGCTYTGQITITGNTSKNAKERFVRADGTGDAVVVIKDNVLINYQSTDADYIKVTNGTNVTIENNIVGPIDPATKTIIIETAEDLLNLSTLNAKWAEKYSNGQGNDFENYIIANGGKGTEYYYKWEWTIKLIADIDLGNVTINAPINIDKWGKFDGQNHTIKNLNVVTANDTQNGAGIFTSSTCSIENLVLDNIHVTGSLVGDSTAGILACDCNNKVDKITISNSSVWGGKYTGAVVGYAYADVNNCQVTNCVVKGGYKLGGIAGYICSNNETQRVINNNTLTNCTVKGTDGQYAGGKSQYIIGKVVGNYNCNGSCSNNTITNMTTDATENIGKIENGCTVTE